MYFYFMHMYVQLCTMYVHRYMGVYSCQKRALEPLELELQEAVIHPM